MENIYGKIYCPVSGAVEYTSAEWNHPPTSVRDMI